MVFTNFIVGASAVEDVIVKVSESTVISFPVATIAKSPEAVIVSPFIPMLSTVRAVRVPSEVIFV